MKTVRHLLILIILTIISCNLLSIHIPKNLSKATNVTHNQGVPSIQPKDEQDSRPKFKKSPGTIIMLHGSSSSGKTSIGDELLKILDKPYERIAMQDFLMKH